MTRSPRPWQTLLAVALLIAAPAAAAASLEHPAAKVVRDLTRSIDHFDLEGFVASFHDDITMIYPIDSIPRRVDGLAELAATQERVFATLGARFAAEGRTEGPFFGLVAADLRVQELSGKAAVVTWHVDRGTHIGRRTAVVQARRGVWKIVSYHASNVPVD